MYSYMAGSRHGLLPGTYDKKGELNYTGPPDGYRCIGNSGLHGGTSDCLYRGAMTGQEGKTMRHGSGERLEDVAELTRRWVAGSVSEN